MAVEQLQGDDGDGGCASVIIRRTTFELFPRTRSQGSATVCKLCRRGVYSYSRIADSFNIHFTTVGRIIRANRKMQQ